MPWIRPWLWALGLLAAMPAFAGDDAALRWIYVEANVGGSSGGHLALRLGETVYHVQQAPGGLYELNREDWETFQHLYAGLQNRTLRLAELDVSPEDLERVERRLARAYVAQRAALERRERLSLDLAWLEAWQGGRPPPALAGAGLLAPAASPDPDAVALRRRIRETLGPDFLLEQRAAVSRTIAGFDPRRDDPLALREALLLREALVALDEGWSLAPAALLPLGGRLAEPLSTEERAGAQRFAETQAEAVLALLRSGRPDRARPLLLASARCQALARSAASGRLVLLDPYAGATALEPAEALSPGAAERVAAELEPVVRDGRAQVLGAERFDEPVYNLLELGAGAWREFAEGARGRPVRRLPRRATPAAARVVAFHPSALPADALDAAVRRAETALSDQERELHARYRYGVLRRNCVTELARLLNDSFEPRDVERALGADLEPGAGLGFIPFVFFDEARARLRVRRLSQVPSHRERELARIEAADPRLARRLREATTLGSTIYRPRLQDGSFLFFTDDVLWSRPLLGLANLGWAAGSGVVGLLAAPFDGAARLRAAGSGLWYSLPELVFANVRKGSFDYVPKEETDAGGGAAAAPTPDDDSFLPAPTPQL